MDIEYDSAQNQQEDEDFEIVDTNVDQSQEQCFFDHVISLLQQIVISAEFEKKILHFMTENWQNIEESNPNKQQETFTKFSTTFTTFLTQKLTSDIPNFQMSYFFELLRDRKNQVDEQLLDTLESLSDINCFNSFMRDCKTSHDEVETYKVLTIKSNKIPEHKSIKGKDNIFGNPTANPLFDMKMKKPTKPAPKQEKMIDKTEDELLVPDLVLTVKGIRKE